jgi:hypothetical protein
MNVIEYIKRKELDQPNAIWRLSKIRARADHGRRIDAKSLQDFVPYSSEYDGTSFAIICVGSLRSFVSMSENGNVSVSELLRMVDDAKREARRSYHAQKIWEELKS